MGRKIKILFLAANPIDTDYLRLGEEVKSIQNSLGAKFQSRFLIEKEWAVRASDLQDHLLHHQPEIVHFSGHGSETSEIFLENDHGESQIVPAPALSQLFSLLKDNIRCVILNSCYSQKQAEAIAKHIDAVVGMSKEIGDQAAINFASAFYQALAYGKNLATAFELGCLQIHLQGLDEQDTPKLLAIKKDAKEIFFVQKPAASKAKTQTQVSRKKSVQVRSIDLLKILTRMQLAEEGREKVKDAIKLLKDLHVSAITLGGPKVSTAPIKLLAPVNTAVRPPLCFRWKVTGEGAKLTDKETLRMRLSVFEPTNSQAKIFQEEFINKDSIYNPPSLEERLIKGHWYKWRVEVFDNKGDILATSTRKENEIEIDPEFQIFLEENLLKSLLERYMRIIIRQERSDFTPHVILGAIYQSLLLRDEAVREYQKAIEKAPQETFLYERAIAVLQQQGHVEQAMILKKRLHKAKSSKKH